jgi:hypothetical protein
MGRLNLLERDRMIERVPNPDGRVKAMRLTGKANDCWTWRGRSGHRRRTGSSASSARRHGPTPSAGWPACFTWPS